MRILHVITVDENNENYYDIFEAFRENEELPFSKDKKLGQLQAKKGDIVYLYLSKPIARVMYKCIVTDDNMDISKAPDDSKYFKSKKYIKEENPNASKTCYMLKKIDEKNSRLLGFEYIVEEMYESKRKMNLEVKEITSFRGFTDKNEKKKYLKETFDYIEKVFDKANEQNKGE